MRIFLSLCFLFFSPVGESALWIQTGEKLDAAKLPRQSATAQDFVPRGWIIEAQIEGDLNRDTIPDLAITLVEQMPLNADKENPPERQRALLILFKTADGQFNRAALADKVLLCTRCGGAFFGVVETPTNVEIANGVVVVKQEYGSRELTNEVFRFRYEPESKRFALIGADVKTFDRMTGEGLTESANFLTGVKIITKTKLDAKTDKSATVSNTQQRVSRDKKFIEDVANGYN